MRGRGGVTSVTEQAVLLLPGHARPRDVGSSYCTPKITAAFGRNRVPSSKGLVHALQFPSFEAAGNRPVA